jgi:CheY-like chemotaxis protein
MPGETVLIVDDAPLNLKLAAILLRREGYDVLTAHDAEQALGILDRVHPTLILVDIQLPGMDGLELTRRVKRNPETSDIVVVALTACAMKGDDLKAYAAGCDGYITKPIDTMSLGAQLRGYLHRSSVESRNHCIIAQGCGGT